MRTEHTCADHEPELSALLDGRLSTGAARRLRRHLAECDGCREELEGVRRARSLLRSLPVREVPAGLFNQKTLGTPRSPDAHSTATTDAPVRPGVAPRKWSAATLLAVATTLVGVMMALSGRDLIVPIEVDVETLALGHESVVTAAGGPIPDPFAVPREASVLTRPVDSLPLGDPQQVDALRAGGWDIPGELPGGHRLVGASVQLHLSGMPVQAVYSDGQHLTSLFLQPGLLDLGAVAGSAEHVDELPDRLAYVWPELPTRMIWVGSGHTYTLIGDAPLDDLTAMARGLAAD